MRTEVIYSPAWWIPGGHLQTLWGKLFRRQRVAPTTLERWNTPDGDFLEIHRLSSGRDAPRLLLLHGLEGSIASHYAQGLLNEAHRRKWGADLLVFRSCGSAVNRARRFYHSGETGDLGFVLDRIIEEFPRAPLALAGVSLGGNVVLKFLGERGEDVPPNLRSAAAISVPFDLELSSRRINRGLSRLYQSFFLHSLKEKTLKKAELFPDLAAPEKIAALRTLEEFDNLVTAPLHGFRDAHDYYRRASSLPYLARIRVSTLLLNAIDDPMLPPTVLDKVRHIVARNPALTAEFVRSGGHAGFVTGSIPGRPYYYAEHRLGKFFAEGFTRVQRVGRPAELRGVTR
jgi:predicted alpha/beta-fold hydrolase